MQFSDISDLEIKHTISPDNKQEALIFTKKPEQDPFMSSAVPENWKEDVKQDLDEKKVRKALNISEPYPDQDDEIDTSNILFIADSEKPDFNLTEFIHVVSYSKDTFQNIPLDQVFLKAKYIWFNIKDSQARYYLSQNLKKNKYNILIVYEGSKTQSWIKELSEFVPEAVTINKQKLVMIDSFSPDHFIEKTLSAIVKISKPTKSLFNMLKMCVCSSKKKV